MTIYEEYALIKQKKEALEKIEKDLAAKIISNLESENKKKESIPLGSFTISSRKNWIFSQEVNDKEEELKVLKEIEKNTEKATYTETKVLTFKKISI